MYQAKVSNTEKYSDSQGEHVVCKGKLILVKTNFNDSLLGIRESGDIISKYSHKEDKSNIELWVKPIIISLQEKIYKDDFVYGGLGDQFKIIQMTSNKNETPFNPGTFQWYKVLALSGYFSNKHLQAIVDGKMKDGDEVLVRCSSHGFYGDSNIKQYWINLDQQNHITLFPAKQSLEEAFEDWWNSDFEFTAMGDPEACYMETFKAGAEWAKKNNY